MSARSIRLQLSAQIRIAFIFQSQPLPAPHLKLNQYELFATQMNTLFTSKDNPGWNIKCFIETNINSKNCL